MSDSRQKFEEMQEEEKSPVSTDKLDIRVYYYQSGSLVKCYGTKKHFHPSVESAEEFIEREKIRFDRQFVIVQYFERYQSKILKVC